LGRMATQLLSIPGTSRSRGPRRSYTTSEDTMKQGLNVPTRQKAANLACGEHDDE
jgi:hypothetical protein